MKIPWWWNPAALVRVLYWNQHWKNQLRGFNFQSNLELRNITRGFSPGGPLARLENWAWKLQQKYRRGYFSALKREMRNAGFLLESSQEEGQQ